MCRNEGRGGSFTKPQSQEPTTKYTQFFSRCCGEPWAYTSERFDAASNNSVRDILSLETKNAESAIGAFGKVVHTQKSSVDTHAPKSHAIHHRAAQDIRSYTRSHLIAAAKLLDSSTCLVPAVGGLHHLHCGKFPRFTSHSRPTRRLTALALNETALDPHEVRSVFFSSEIALHVTGSAFLFGLYLTPPCASPSLRKICFRPHRLKH